MRQAGLTMAVSAALLLAGCSSPSEPLPPEWKGRNIEASGWSNTTVRANWSFGLEYPLPAGETITWNWVALTNGALYFRLFLVLNGQAIPVGAQHNNEGKGSYETKQPGSYYFVWDLDGLPDTQLFYKLPEGGIPYDWPPGSGPGCPPMMLC